MDEVALARKFASDEHGAFGRRLSLGDKRLSIC